MATAESYLHAKFHLDPPHRLATVHQRYRQTGQDRQDNGPIAWANSFRNGRPKTEMLRRNGPVVKSEESVLRLGGILWWERYVKKVGL